MLGKPLHPGFARKSIERLVNLVLGVLIERPPHGHVVLQQGAMVSLAHLKRHGCLSSDLEGFGADVEREPLPIVVIRVPFDGFSEEVDLVVHKHRHAPRVVAGVANDGKGQTADVVAVVLELWRHDMRFVPHRWRRVGHVGVVAEEHLTRRGAVATQHPRVGPQPLGHGAECIQLVHLGGQARDVTGLGGNALVTVVVPIHVCDARRVEVVDHPIEDGLGFQVDGEGVRHESSGTVDVVQVKRLWFGVDQAVFKGQFSRRDVGVHAVEVGLHGVDNVGVFAVALELLYGSICRFAHAQRPQVLVVVDHVGAQQSRQLSPSCPSQQVHLPQAFHGVNVPERMQGVVLGFRINVRHRHVVKHNFHVCLEGIGFEVKPVIGGNGLGGDVHEAEKHGDHHGEHAQDVFHV